MKRCLLLALLLLFTREAHAIGPSAPERSFALPHAGVEVFASVLFSEPGEFGAYPVRVRIKNSSGQARTWHCSITGTRTAGWSNSYVSHAYLTVEHGESKTFELFTMLLPDSSTGYNAPQSIRIRMSGYGISVGEHNYTQPYRDYKLAKLPYTVLSPAISLRSGSVLTDEFAKASKSFPSITFDLGAVSEDWRQLTGAPIIWLSLEEWIALPPGQRAAISSWILVGGRLVVFSSYGRTLAQDELAMPFLSRWNGTEGYYGLGQVKLGSWNGQEVSFAEALSLVPDQAALPLSPSDSSLGEMWRLVDRVPAPELNTFLVVTLLFVYAVIVGPVNLRYATRRGARQLIFVTTPLIALVSCLALFGLIVMKDGFGGWGARNLAVLIEGSTHRALVVQEQISRTGVLLDDSLSLPRDYLLIPLELFKQGYRSERNNYEAVGNEFTDGWVGNRARQAQLAFGVVPTRARLTYDANAKTVLSSIETELKTLFLKDNRGTWWKASKVLPGRPSALTRSSAVEYLTWSQGTIERSVSPSISKPLAVLQESPSAFFAEAASDGGFTIPVLNQFSWEQGITIFYGPL